MSKVVLLRLHETKETEGWVRERQGGIRACTLAAASTNYSQ